MLTGDKLETAHSIGLSCKLITANMDIIKVRSLQDLQREFTEAQSCVNSEMNA